MSVYRDLGVSADTSEHGVFRPGRDRHTEQEDQHVAWLSHGSCLHGLRLHQTLTASWRFQRSTPNSLSQDTPASTKQNYPCGELIDYLSRDDMAQVEYSLTRYFGLLR